MRYWCDFILHFLLSNSRHGTHSPFVYKMADKVIYNNDVTINSSEGCRSELLIRNLQAFLKDEMGEEAFVCSIESVSLDAVIHLHQKYSSIILKDLYKTSEAKKIWSLVRQDPSILVTIDLFYFGILIYRVEQRKENFRLRFPLGNLKRLRLN